MEQIPANRRLIETLHAHGRITGEAMEYAIGLLYPNKRWGLWASRILLIIGTGLVLSGIIYFFAFNWMKIPPAAKFAFTETGIVICLGMSWHYGLQDLAGKVLLLSASVLVGVFLAVFGQIYQTGADAYQLFMMWAILISGWVAISRFAALWFVWMVIVNIFVMLYWEQAALPSKDAEFMIFSYLTLLNGFFLVAGEYLTNKGSDRAADRRLRIVLAISVLISMSIPMITLIAEPGRATGSVVFGAVLGFAGHGILLFSYRYKLPDIWVLSLTILSLCIIAEIAGFKMLSEMFRRSEATMFLLMGGMTLGIFTFAIIRLRKIAGNMEERNVR